MARVNCPQRDSGGGAKGICFRFYLLGMHKYRSGSLCRKSKELCTIPDALQLSSRTAILWEPASMNSRPNTNPNSSHQQQLPSSARMHFARARSTSSAGSAVPGAQLFPSVNRDFILPSQQLTNMNVFPHHQVSGPEAMRRWAGEVGAGCLCM